ncbi:MAG: antibiotic biosynthesis monooxygenase [Curvibacter sp. PD_MW3]|nr:MAG: antibiotic biosynthesis monooxygenase [Curvibacter sp. PD_MW3]
MYVVIFRARVRALDDEYSRVAARMRELALSYWPSEEAIRAWKSHPEHVLAQQAGRERWYASYSVEVAQITREYRVAC